MHKCPEEIIGVNSISVTFNSEGSLLVKEVFSKQAKQKILNKPKTHRLRSGENIVLFVNPGVKYELMAATFAP